MNYFRMGRTTIMATTMVEAWLAGGLRGFLWCLAGIVATISCFFLVLAEIRTEKRK